MRETDETWRELAGPLYDELIRSKEAALSRLFAPERDVRIAAIHICQSTWQCSTDSRFLDSCRRLANTDPDDLVREHAASSLGMALCASQDRSTSQFLAALAKNGVTPQHVRMAAYWALREVQLGLTEEDLVRRSAALMKIAMRRLPTGISEEDAKRTALCDGRFADGVWDTAEQIDWNFVDKFLSLEAG